MRRILGFAASFFSLGIAAAQTATDRVAIIELTGALDTAVDAKDWEAAEALFTEDLVFTYGTQPPQEMKASELVGMWSTNLFETKTSFHLRGGHVVTFDDRSAGTVTSKAYAWNRLEGLEGGDLWEVWGDYTYRVVEEDGTWKIAGFAFNPVLERGNKKVPGYRPEE